MNLQLLSPSFVGNTVIKFQLESVKKEGEYSINQLVGDHLVVFNGVCWILNVPMLLPRSRLSLMPIR